ncbi:MAG: M48 family metallopeptidase [Gemmatimonadota bacterium]
MTARLKLGGMVVDVVLKDIKNVHLSVYPPEGSVRISAPRRMKIDTIRAFAASKLDWIRQQQNRLRAQERETPRDYSERESHYVWGKRYLLTVREADERPSIELRQKRMVLRLRPGTDETKREAIVDKWYREQIKLAVPPLVAEWAPLIGVELEHFFVQRMKSKWGSCNHDARTIRLNSELAKKPAECLEYIVVHELVHLIEPTHNPHFTALMDRFMPNWRHKRQVLNRLPVRREMWSY